MPDRIIPPTRPYVPIDSEQLVQPRYIGNLEPLNNYDIGLREGYNQTYLRGANQTAFQQLRNAAIRFVPSVAMKLGEGVALTGSLGLEAIKAMGPDYDFSFENAINSPMAEAFSKAEKHVENKWAPIYGSQKYHEGNLAQKLWTTSFLSQDFMDGVEFLGSAFLPGAAIGKLGSAGKLLQASKIAKARSLGKALESTKAAIGLGEVGNLSSTLLTTTFNTLSESLIEGSHMYKEVKTDLKKRFPQMSEEEINKKAANAAKNVFGYNMLYLAVPNFAQTTWMHGTSNFSNLRKLREVGKITDAEVKELRKSLGLGALKGFVSEGLWEENIQSAVTEMEKRTALNTLDKNDSQFKFLSDGVIGLARAIPDIFTFGNLGTSAEAGSIQDQQATAALLGGLIGAPMSLWGTVKENKDFSTAFSDAQNRHKTALNYMYKATNSLPSNVTPVLKSHGKNPDGTTKWVDDNGEMQYDLEALNNINRNHALNKLLHVEATEAAVKNDKLHFTDVVNRAKANLAFEISDLVRAQDLSEDDIDYLIETRLAQINKETKEGQEVDPLSRQDSKQLEIENILAQSKSEIKQNIKLALDAKDRAQSADDFSNDRVKIQFSRDLSRAIYYAETRKRDLEKLKSQIDPNNTKASEDLDKLIQDNTDAIEYFTKSSNRKRLVEDYKKEVAPFVALSEELEELQNKATLSKTEDEKTDLIKQIEDVKYKLLKLQTIEGAEKLVGSGPASTTPDSMLGMFDTMTSNMFGPRQTSEGFKSVSLKHAAYYNLGKSKLADEKIKGSLDTLEQAQRETLQSLDRGGETSFDPLLNALDDVINTIGEEVGKQSSISTSLIDKSVELAIPAIDTIVEQIAKIRDQSQSDEEYDEFNAIIATIEDKLNDLERYRKTADTINNSQQEMLDATLSKNDEFFNKLYFELYNSITKSLFEDDRPLFIVEDDTLKVRADFDESPSTILTAIQKLKVSLRSSTPEEITQEIYDLYKERLQLLEDLVLPFVMSKSEQRAAKQERFEKIQSEVMLSSLMDPTVLSVLKTIIPDIEERLTKLSKDVLESGAYTHILKILDEIKSNKKSEQVIDLLNSLITDKLSTYASTLKSFGINDYMLDRLMKNKASVNTLGQIMYTAVSTDSNSIMREYQMKTQDIYSLHEELENSGWANVSDNSKNIIDTVLDINTMMDSISFIKNVLVSDLDFKTQIEAETKLYSKKEYSPTFQQRHVALSVMYWIKTPVIAKQSLTKLIALRGMIGTGKTKITLNHILKSMMEANALTKDELLLVGHSSKSSKQLNKLIKGVESDKTWADHSLDVDNSLKGIKLIVVDEAGALSREDMVSLRNKTGNIKIILAGDGSQNVVEESPDFIGNSLYVQQTVPLNVVYRTNIAAIVNAANQFRNKLDLVEEVNFQSNKESIKDVKSDIAGSLGVMSMSAEDVLSIVSTPSSRSRLVIVANPIEAAKYRGLISDPNTKVEVLDYLEVQGTEAEEVYVMIPPTSQVAYANKSFTTEAYNAAMYTSIGRATKFAGVVLYGTKANQMHVPSLEAQADSLEKDFENINNSYLAALNTGRELLGLESLKPLKATQQPVKSEPTTPLEKELEKDETTEDWEEDSEIPDSPEPDDDIRNGGVVVDEQELVTLPANEYLLSFPTNSNLPSASRNIDFLDYSNYFIVRSSTANEWLVVVKHKNYTSNNKVVPVAVLGDADLREDSALGAYLKAVGAFNKSVPTIAGFASNVSAETGISIPNIDNVAVASFKEGKIRHSIQFDYGTAENRTWTELSSYGIGNIVKKFISSLFYKAMGKSDLELPKEIKDLLNSPKGIDWKALKAKGLHVTIKVYNRAQVKKIAKDHEFVPKWGRPYLVIEGLRWEAGKQKRTEPTPFFIELSPKKYNPNKIKNLTYMQDFMNTITNFRDAFKLIKGLFPPDTITINKKVKNKDGKLVEGIFQRMLDYYAKNAFLVNPENYNKQGNKFSAIEKNPNYDRKEFLSKFKDELPEFTETQLNILFNSLDILVPITYSIKTQNKYISYGEYKSKGIKGQFLFTSRTKNRDYTKAIQSGKTEEEAIKIAGITDTDNVEYAVVDSVKGTTSFVKEERITRGNSPLQLALDVIAGSNQHLSIAQERTRIGSDNQKSIYKGAKNIFSSLDKNSAYHGKIRDWLTEEIGNKLLNAATRVFPNNYIQNVFEVFNEDLPQSLFARTDFYETLPDGTQFTDRVRIRYKDGKITFAYQDSTEGGSLKPLAIYSWVNAIVGHVERASTNKDMINLFQGTDIGTVEGVRKWRDEVMQPKYNEIESETQLNPMTIEEIDEILERDGTGDYTNVYTPLMKNGWKAENYKDETVDNAGKLEDKNSVDLMESILQTRFKGVTPTRISIQIPEVSTSKSKPAKPQSPQQNKPKPVPGPPTLTVEDEIQQVSATSSNITRTTTVGEMLKKVTITEPYLKRILDILTLNKEIYDLKVNEIKKWKTILKKHNFADRTLASYVAKTNSLNTSSIEELENNPVLFLHELVHSQINIIIGKPASTRTQKEQEFFSQLEVIYNEFQERNRASNNALGEKVFAETFSELDIYEFFASMTNPNFYTELSKENIILDKVPESVKQIWQQIWDAVLSFLGIDNIDKISLAEATYSSFEAYMISRFKQAEEFSQIAPPPPVVDEVVSITFENQQEEFEYLLSQVKDEDDRETWNQSWEQADTQGYRELQLKAMREYLGLSQSKGLGPILLGDLLTAETIIPIETIEEKERLDEPEVKETHNEKVLNHTVETVITQEVSQEELEEISEEEGVTPDVVATTIREEVKNNYKNKTKTSYTKKIGAAIKKVLKIISTILVLKFGYLVTSAFVTVNNYEVKTPYISSIYTVDNSNFKASSLFLTESKQCAEYVHSFISNKFGNSEKVKLNLFGHAWQSTWNMVSSGNGTFIHNIFDNVKPVGLKNRNEINNYIKSKYKQFTNFSEIRPGDLVNIFYSNSSYTKEAYETGSPVFSTHLGIVTIGKNNEIFVEHNIHGVVQKDPLINLLKASAEDKMFVTAIARPNYSTSVESKSFTNYFSEIEGAQKFLKLFEYNKSSFLNLYPNITSELYDQLVRLNIGILNRESTLGSYGKVRGKLGAVKDVVMIFGGFNPSLGVGQTRLNSVPSKVRNEFFIKDNSDLLLWDKGAIASMGVILDIYTNQIPNDRKTDYNILIPAAYRNRTLFKELLEDKTKIVNDPYTNFVLNTANKVIISKTNLGPISTIEQKQSFSLGKIKGEIKEGVDLIYQNNTELNTVGTPEEYSQYLDDTLTFNKVLAHSTVIPFEDFDQTLSTMVSKDLGPGLYVSDTVNASRWAAYQEMNSGVIWERMNTRVKELLAEYYKIDSLLYVRDLEAKLKEKYWKQSIEKGIELYGRTDEARDFALDQIYKLAIDDVETPSVKEALLKLRDIKFKPSKKASMQFYGYTGNTPITFYNDAYLQYTGKEKSTFIIEGDSSNVKQGVLKDKKDYIRLGTKEDLERFKSWKNSKITLDSKFSPVQISDAARGEYYDKLIGGMEDVQIIQSMDLESIPVMVDSTGAQVNLFKYKSEKNPNWARLNGSLENAIKALKDDRNSRNNDVIGYEQPSTLSKETTNNIIDSLTDQGFFKKQCK